MLAHSRDGSVAVGVHIQVRKLPNDAKDHKRHREFTSPHLSSKGVLIFLRSMNSDLRLFVSENYKRYRGDRLKASSQPKKVLDNRKVLRQSLRHDLLNWGQVYETGGTYESLARMAEAHSSRASLEDGLSAFS